METYGSLPTKIADVNIFTTEMMFYQYLPIKMLGGLDVRIEPRVRFLDDIIRASIRDFVEQLGHDSLDQHYIYLTIKNTFQTEGCTQNREGWHSDGFMTDDINYIWYDCNPTIFNTSKFELDMNDVKSIEQMHYQALPENDIVFPAGTLLRLSQYNIHQANPYSSSGMRLFVKLSFSKDKYDLIGNSHNYLFNYNWDMRPRIKDRNIPQKIK